MGGEERKQHTTRSRDPWRDLGRQASSCAQLTVRAKNTETSRVWSREMLAAGPCKETGGSCLKKEKNHTPQKLLAKPLSRKGEGGVWLVVENLLVSDLLFLRSRHGRVRVFHKSSPKMLFSVLRRKGRVPRLNFPLQVQGLAKT